MPGAALCAFQNRLAVTSARSDTGPLFALFDLLVLQLQKMIKMYVSSALCVTEIGFALRVARAALSVS